MLIRRTNWIVAKNLDFGRKIHPVVVPEVKGRKGFKIKGEGDWQHNLNLGIMASTEIGFDPRY